MLMPNRTKYRRPHRQSYEGRSKAGREIVFGEYGLIAYSGAYVSNRQIEAACRHDSLHEAWRPGLDQNLPTSGNYEETAGSPNGFR